MLPIGVLLKYLTKGDLVYDAHELETETFVLFGIRKRLSKLVEKWLIGHVALTVVGVTVFVHGMKQNMMLKCRDSIEHPSKIKN